MSHVAQLGTTMRTALHFALQGAHDVAVRGASHGAHGDEAATVAQRVRDFDWVVRALASHPRFDAAYGCPIVDALHFRNMRVRG